MKSRSLFLLFGCIVFLSVLSSIFVQYRQNGKPLPETKRTETPDSNKPSRLVRAKTSDSDIAITLVHDQSNPHSANAPFVPSHNAYAQISIFYAPNTDGSTETILSENLSELSTLPITLYLTGNLAETFKNQRGYFISAKVFNHDGDKLLVNDLASEIQTEINAKSKKIELKLFGLEDCTAPNSGGFCTSRKSP